MQRKTFAFLIIPVISGFSRSVSHVSFSVRPLVVPWSSAQLPVMLQSCQALEQSCNLVTPSQIATQPHRLSPLRRFWLEHILIGRKAWSVCVYMCGREFGLLAVNSEMNSNSHHLTFHLSLHIHTRAGTHKRATLLAKKQSSEWSAEGIKCSVTLCVRMWVRERKRECLWCVVCVLRG